jgi:hypothetical protein
MGGQDMKIVNVGLYGLLWPIWRVTRREHKDFQAAFNRVGAPGCKELIE